MFKDVKENLGDWMIIFIDHSSFKVFGFLFLFFGLLKKIKLTNKFGLPFPSDDKRDQPGLRQRMAKPQALSQESYSWVLPQILVVVLHFFPFHFTFHQACL